MVEIEQNLAKQIIMKLGQSGEPPEIGTIHFSVGLDSYLNALDSEYLDGILKTGMSAFKLILGDYGAGKTHFLYCLREKAWQRNYAVSMVALNPRDCPFDKLQLVYKEIVQKIMLKPENSYQIDMSSIGLKVILEDWCRNTLDGFNKKQQEINVKLDDLVNKYLYGLKGVESASFLQAVKVYFRSYVNGDYATCEFIEKWLYGEPIPKVEMHPYHIYEKLDSTTAFRMIRSLCQFIREIGYTGLVILFDEGERQTSIASMKSRKIAFDNIRQVIDECGNSRLPGAFFCYAVPPSFLDQVKQYPALSQRLSSGINFSDVNPSGVLIDLEHLDLEPEALLMEIGKKLWNIYKIAFPNDVADLIAYKNISNMAEEVYNQTLDVSYRRIFVKALIEMFNTLRSGKESFTIDESRQIVRSTVNNLKVIETERMKGRYLDDDEAEDNNGDDLDDDYEF
jgi:hypothetical protein